MALQRFPTAIFKNYYQFFIGGAVTYYLIGLAAQASMNSNEFINDPRHPRFARGEKVVEIEK